MKPPRKPQQAILPEHSGLSGKRTSVSVASTLAITKVEATDTEVRFPESPLCSGKIACCGFLGGFMQGFLDAGPLTAGTRVDKVSCKTKGDGHCGFKIQYDL